jgi:hypothetical protein
MDCRPLTAGIQSSNLESTPKSLKVDFQQLSNLLPFGVDSIFKSSNHQIKK